MRVIKRMTLGCLPSSWSDQQDTTDIILELRFKCVMGEKDGDPTDDKHYRLGLELKNDQDIKQWAEQLRGFGSSLRLLAEREGI